MYPASNEFHNAVANNAHQIALLIFQDAVFTNDDINISTGITFNDYFNTEEDLAIGQALSNEISFSIFNDNGLLNNYPFGEFTATIGAQVGNETLRYMVDMTTKVNGKYINSTGGISSSTNYCYFTEYIPVLPNTQYTFSGTNIHSGGSSTTLSTNVAFYDSSKTFLTRYGSSNSGDYTFTTTASTEYVRFYCGKSCSNVYVMKGGTAAGGTVQANSTYHSYTAYSSSPYLKRDGTAVSSQPARPIVSILIYNDYVYCLLDNNAVVIYNDSTGAIVSGISVNDFMKAQMAKWAGEGIYYGQIAEYGTKLLYIWKGDKKLTYEFVPLGVFNAERPNVPYVNELNFTCYDRMQEFDVDMPSDSDLEVSYPLYFSDLYTAMCDYLNVPYESATFINSGARLSKRPDEFDSATMRDVLKWIAEAACAVARFDRDGQLKMDWLHETDLEIDESGYSDFSPYWYETTRVGKLYNQASNGDYEYITGDGDEAYLIQDNPLLKGVSE